MQWDTNQMWKHETLKANSIAVVEFNRGWFVCGLCILRRAPAAKRDFVETLLKRTDVSI